MASLLSRQSATLAIISLLIHPAVNADALFDPHFIYSPVEAPKSPLVSTWDATQTALSNGSARRSYSFPVPPGTTEAATPELTLQLLNQRKGKPGLLGLSWDIAQTYIVRDDKATKAHLVDDEFNFILQGERHKLVSVGIGEFRTEIDIAARIFQRSGGPGGEHWQVEFPDGTTMELGNSHDSAYTANTKDATVEFLSKAYLKKQTDANGNPVFFNYVKDPIPGDDGAIYPSSIEYGTNRLQKIIFTYAPRIDPEIFPFIEYGSWIQSGQHLNEISMYSASSFVRSFRFHYKNNTVNTRQLLDRVEEIGDDGSASRDTLRIGYKPLNKSFSSISETWSTHEHWLRHTDDDSDLVRDIFDINCDSLPDLVSYKDNDYNGQNDVRRYEIKPGMAGGGFSDNIIVWPIQDAYAEDIDQLRDIVGEDGKAPDVHGTFMHADSDQCIDYYHANGSITIYKNSGAGLDLSRTISSPYHAKIDDAQKPDGKAPNVRNGVRNFNPDPYPDLVRRITLDNGSRAWEVYWGTKNGGFISGGTWPVFGVGWLTDLERNDGDTEATIFDFNGDGYQDYIISSSKERHLFINTGSNFVEIPCHNCGGLDDDLVDTDDSGNISVSSLIDINADGLPDDIDGKSGERAYEVKFGTGRGYTDITTWTYGGDIPADGYIRDQSPDDDSDRTRTRRDLIDMDGDGDVDIARKTGGGILVYRNHSQNADMVERIQEMAGGFVKLNYKASNSPYSSSPTQNPNPQLAHAIQVVDKITRDNDMPTGQAHHIEAMESYEYRGGEYDSEDQLFKGFSNVQVARADLGKEQHQFHIEKPHRGKEHHVAIKDDASTLFQEVFTTWTEKPTLAGVSGSVPTRTTKKTYDGIATPRVIGTDRVFDQYLNETRRSEQGDVAVLGDERLTETVYTNIPNKYIKNRPEQVTIKNDRGVVLRKTSSVFDPNGNERYRTEWRDDGDDPVTEWAYTAEGLVDTVVDAGGAISDTDYDPQFNAFPTFETNAEGHITERKFDSGSGLVTWEKAPNGGIAELAYDPFKRPTKTARPGDTLASPTEEIRYDTDGHAPERVITLRKGATATERSQTFVDGFGFVLQQRQDAENGMQAITEHFWDNRGRYDSVSISNFSMSSNAYIEPLPPIRRSSLHYDVLGRLVQFDNPTNNPGNPSDTFVTQDYKQNIITRTDERGVPKDFHVDAYNQVREIVEHNDTENYTTLIDVDVVGDLQRIVDTQGNESVFHMNSLGWFMGIDHPAMGSWSYTRQQMGEVLSQTDARGVVRSVDYDNIYRPTLITNPSSVNTLLVYDENDDIGALTSYSSIAGLVERDYDFRFRKTKEQRSLDGHTWAMQQEYDPQDRVTAKVYPDGERVAYNYNLRGLLETITGNQPLISSTTFNASGLPTNIGYGNSVSTSRDYDPNRLWPTSIVTPGLQDFSIDYDAVGNPTSLFESIEGRMQLFQYDRLARLIRATDGTSERSFNYSPVHALTNVAINGEAIEFAHTGTNPYAPSSIATDEAMVPQHYRN